MSFVLMDRACDDRRMPNATRIPAGDSTVVIRVATPADIDDLRRLAALDSARALLGTVLVAQTDGAIRAAYSVEEGRAVADPFVASAGLVDLLEARGARLMERGALGRRRPRRLRLVTAGP